MPRHHLQHAPNMGPILFARNENIAHVMPHVTACAVTSCVYCAAHARQHASHPNYTWRTRNYLWTCRSLIIRGAPEIIYGHAVHASRTIFIKNNCLTF